MDFGLLPTTVVGSWPQPDWLVDRDVVLRIGPPRVRARQIWRIAEPQLESAQDDATLVAIREMERCGVDILTDGEIRRESYSNRFATALDGISDDPPGVTMSRIGKPIPAPRIVGPIRRTRPILVRDMKFLRAATDRAVKITVPGPFTMTMQSQDLHYGSREKAAMAYAEAVNAEVRDLFAAGADIVQLDEPWMQAFPEEARAFALPAIARALDGATGTTAIHLCFGYANSVKDKPSGYSFLPELNAAAAGQISIEAAQPDLDLAVLEKLPAKQVMVGVIAMNTEVAETAETVAGRLRAALRHIPAERLVVAPDCGMKYISREAANAKLAAMVQGTEIVRRELRAKR